MKIAFKAIDIVPSDGALGHLRYTKGGAKDKIWALLEEPNSNKDPRVTNWVHRDVVMGFAGSVAQRKFAPSSHWRHDASGDVIRINVWLRPLIAGPPDHSNDHLYDDYYDDETGDFYGDIAPTGNRLVDDKILKALRAKFRRRAVVLVDRLWPEIQIVAAALLKQKVLSEAEVRNLMTAARRAGAKRGDALTDQTNKRRVRAKIETREDDASLPRV